MDLRLHYRVLQRFRYLVIGGFVCALALTFLSFFRVEPSNGFKIGYRQDQTWESTETVLLTQRNSPLFSTNPLTDAGASTSDWLQELPSFYAQLANSNIISAQIRADHSLHGTYNASQVFDTSHGAANALPFLEFDALSTSRAGAVKLASTVSNLFLSYVSGKQASQQIPSSRRVLMQVVTAPTLAQAEVVVPRKKTIPIIVFLAVMVASLGLAYILENLRPRAGDTIIPAEPVEEPQASYVLRSSGSQLSGATRRRA